MGRAGLCDRAGERTVRHGGSPERPVTDSVLVVIPCLNEADHIAALLGRLLSEPSPVDLLVVAADGGSQDGTIEIIEAAAAADPRVRLLANPKKIQSAGVNLAVKRYGEGREWLVRVDAHGDCPENFVPRLIEQARRVGAPSVVVTMQARGATCFQKGVAAAQNSILGNGGAAHRRQAAGGWTDHGHHALIALSDFRELGGYDEAFAVNEDIDFDWRLAGAGRGVWLSSDLAVTYYPRRSPLGLWRQYFRFGAARVRTLRRHGRQLARRQFVVLSVAPAAALATFGLFWPPLALPAAVWAAGSCGYGLLLAIQARQACAAWAGPAAMIMHFAWSVGYWSERLRVRDGPVP
jgi:succinoglycan biosynthesis protein ExoA